MPALKPPPGRDLDFKSPVWQEWFRSLQRSAATVIDSPTVDNFASIDSEGNIQDSGYDSTSFVRVDGAQDIVMTAPETWKVGDGTNYVEFQSDGEIGLAGTARTTNALSLDASGIRAVGAHPATEIAHGTLEVPAWQFANQVVEANQETVSWIDRIPKRMDRTVAPTIIIGWSSNTNAGNVKWQLEYLWRTLNEDTTSGAQGTIPVITAVSATADGLAQTTFTGIDIPSSVDVCLHCRLTRLSASADDTVADTVELQGYCFDWTSNKLGAAT